jgi:triacylglycerol lipase
MIKTIKYCMELCVKSYQSSITNKKYHSFYNPINDTSGFWHIKDKVLFITFRGTVNLKDFIFDFLFFKKTIPYDNQKSDIKVHEGFLLKYKGVIRDYIQRIVKKHKSIKNIIVTGHSLGGAIATLCAIDLQYNFTNKHIECITFASPRVGNQAFVDSFNKRISFLIRVKNDNDFIPHLPFKILGFNHVGNLKQVGKPQFLYSIKNHLWINYMKVIDDMK